MLGRLARLVPCGIRALSYSSQTTAARTPTTSRSWSRSIVLSLGLGAGGGVLVYQPTAEELKAAYLTPIRLARDVYTAAAIVADYKWSLGSLSGEAREEALRGCHQRGADRLLALCFANGGVYTKLGQHIGQLDHLLPDEYVLTMKQHLLDRCPVSGMEEVRAVFMQDFGAPPEQLFQYFNPLPIASASLAQVHEARDHSGRKLAVKVQHAGLRENCVADMATVAALVGAVRLVFPDFDYSWLVDEMRENLPKELDFRHEASNAERCRANLQLSAQEGIWHAGSSAPPGAPRQLDALLDHHRVGPPARPLSGGVKALLGGRRPHYASAKPHCSTPTLHSIRGVFPVYHYAGP